MSPPGHAPVRFGCEVAELGDEVLVIVTGDVDLRVAGEFARCLADATRPGKPVFIDLTSAGFIDGRGYRAIRAAARSLPPGARPPVTVATRSAVIAAVLQATAGSLIRVQLS